MGGRVGTARSGTHAKVTGTRAKEVICEKCQFAYVYTITRHSTGALSSPTGKQYETVEHQLEVLLHTSIDPVPCPSCGWMQTDMIPIAKATYRTWMNSVGGILLTASVAGMFLSLLTFAVSATQVGRAEIGVSVALLVGSLSLYASRAYLVLRFDPNAIDPGIQKVIGQRASITKGQYEKVQADVRSAKTDARERAKRNMAKGYGLPVPADEFVNCRYCGHRQVGSKRKCESCRRTQNDG